MIKQQHLARCLSKRAIGWAWAMAVMLAAGSTVADDLDRTFLYRGDVDKFVKEAPPAPLYITGGTLIDGEGQPRPNPGILMRDGRFVAIGGAEPPADAKRIDAQGKWIVPGMFDLHAHITFHLPSGFHVEDDTLNALRSERFLESYQRIGVTTVRDVASRNNVGYSLKRAQRMGLMRGARLYVSGPGITVSGGHATEFQPYEPPAYAVEADGPWQMRQRVRQAVKLGADFIKVLPPLTLEEMRAVVDEARFWKLRVTAHAGGLQDLSLQTAMSSVEAGVDSLEHLYPYGSSADTRKVLAKIVERGIYVVPTVAYHLNELASLREQDRQWVKEHVQHTNETMFALLKQMKAAGVKLAVGTDSNAIHMLQIDQLYLSELKGLQQGGLSNAEIIRAATLTSAEAMGLGGEAGSIRAGKRADLSLLDRDPLQTLDALVVPSVVIQQGEVVYSRQ
jgi:imidazolonepropionase-like amidohydrolase